MFSANFKYYIHDGTDACRIQLLGQLGEAEIAELSSCWETARTTLGTRPLLLDARKVTALDEAGKKWFAQMVQEGARCLPESFLMDAMAGRCDAQSQDPNRTKVGLFYRLTSFLRGASLETEPRA